MRDGELIIRFPSFPTYFVLEYAISPYLILTILCLLLSLLVFLDYECIFHFGENET